METNETLKQELLKEAEQAIEALYTGLQTIEEGDLQEVEQQMVSTMLSLGRTCLERVLTSQAAGQEDRARRMGTCGHRQHLVGKRPRQVLTLLGPISIRRGYYQCVSKEEEQERCHSGAPFDQRWGLTQQHSSPGVQRLVSYLSARLTHDEVAETVERLLPLRISARQVGQVIQPIGERLTQQEDQRVQALLSQGLEKHTSAGEQQEAQTAPITRLSIEMDGVMARLRRGSVPMEQAEQARGGDVYREVKVGAVFEGLPGHKRSELVPSVFVDTPGPIQYTARRTSAEAFGPHLYALAHRAGLARATQIVVLADGAKWIWRLADEQFPGAVQIVDEYHARQHVWEVARAAFAQPSERDGWAQQVIEKLSEGKLEEVIAAIEQLPPLAPEPGKGHSVLEIEAAYFRCNAQRMRYPLFRAQGMHLGSGIAEAACKTVVATRAKRSGMRWTPQGLDAILALRTAVLNEEFDQQWQVSREAA